MRLLLVVAFVVGTLATHADRHVRTRTAVTEKTTPATLATKQDDNTKKDQTHNKANHKHGLPIRQEFKKLKQETSSTKANRTSGERNQNKSSVLNNVEGVSLNKNSVSYINGSELKGVAWKRKKPNNRDINKLALTKHPQFVTRRRRPGSHTNGDKTTKGFKNAGITSTRKPKEQTKGKTEKPTTKFMTTVNYESLIKTLNYIKYNKKSDSGKLKLTNLIANSETNKKLPILNIRNSTPDNKKTTKSAGRFSTRESSTWMTNELMNSERSPSWSAVDTFSTDSTQTTWSSNWSPDSSTEWSTAWSSDSSPTWSPDSSPTWSSDSSPTWSPDSSPTWSPDSSPTWSTEWTSSPLTSGNSDYDESNSNGRNENTDASPFPTGAATVANRPSDTEGGDDEGDGEEDSSPEAATTEGSSPDILEMLEDNLKKARELSDNIDDSISSLTLNFQSPKVQYEASNRLLQKPESLRNDIKVFLNITELISGKGQKLMLPKGFEKDAFFKKIKPLLLQAPLERGKAQDDELRVLQNYKIIQEFLKPIPSEDRKTGVMYVSDVLKEISKISNMYIKQRTQNILFFAITSFPIQE